jgi:hypothetical protein
MGHPLLINTAIEIIKNTGLSTTKTVIANTRSKALFTKREIREISDFSKVKKGIPSCGDGISQ